MTKKVISALAFSLLAAGAMAQEQEQQAAPEAEGEKIVITGQRPGPGLWKVYKGEHVMWVFGKYGPLPKKMEWRSHEVESILGKSQEYLSEPGAHAGVGVWGGIKLLAALPSLWNLQHNPNGAKLQDVVPPETYARWLALKEKYIGNDKDVENYRPIFAASTLYESGLQRIGLSAKDEVRPAIEKLVKRAGIKVTSSDVSVNLSDAGTAVKEFRQTSLDDAACFATTLAQMEGDIDHMRVRANAWAVGDIETIRKLDFGDRESACKAALQNSAPVQSRPELVATIAKSRELWLANAEKALENNSSTFAVLKMNDILAKDGLLAALQARGYRVEAPE